MANVFDVIHEGKQPSGTPACEDFHRLADEWKSQAEFLASPTAIAAIPAYQAIIAMGPAAVPLILNELPPRTRPLVRRTQADHR